ncbi:MAG: rhodanese-like domain-containing protein [Gammaproteobacteria bacterium]|nr:rhodanese-like domain-containing protein [Gammaproteobacteria bacterium]
MESFVIAHWYLFLALVVVVAALIAQPLMSAASGVAAVTPTEAVQILNHQNGVIIDVREPSEFKSGHIMRAINIPLSQVGTRSQELKKYKDRPVILCCVSGARSARAAGILRQQGFSDPRNLGGGLNAWRSQNLPLES